MIQHVVAVAVVARWPESRLCLVQGHEFRIHAHHNVERRQIVMVDAVLVVSKHERPTECEHGDANIHSAHGWIVRRTQV